MKKAYGSPVLLASILVMMALMTGCGGGSSPPGSGGTTVSSGAGSTTGSVPVSTATTKNIILQMTTFCENDPYTTLQFNYAANNNDGCGITFGCIGFTTGTYSGNILIQYYTTLNPNNTLAKYIPVLNRIDSEVQSSSSKSSDITGLDNFINDVHSCTDTLFKQAQIHELDQMFWNPAVTMVANIGAKYPITLAFIYDMCVNHGTDGAQRYINQTNTAMGGSPAGGIDEKQWLEQCISIRNSTASGIGDRSIAFKRVLESGNVNLLTPFTFSVYGDTCTINGNVGD